MATRHVAIACAAAAALVSSIVLVVVVRTPSHGSQVVEAVRASAADSSDSGGVLAEPGTTEAIVAELSIQSPKEVVERFTTGDLRQRPLDPPLAAALADVAMRPDLGEDALWANIIFDVFGERASAGLLDDGVREQYRALIIDCLDHEHEVMRGFATSAARREGLLDSDPFVRVRLEEIAENDPSDFASELAATNLERHDSGQ